MRSIVVGGRESLDTPIDLQSDLSSAVVTFTDQTERDHRHRPAGQIPTEDRGAVVVLVPADYQRSLDEGRPAAAHATDERRQRRDSSRFAICCPATI